MALYPDDAIGSFTVPGFSSMKDRKPDNEFSIDKEYSVSKWVSEAGYEKRRLKSRRPTRELELKYTNINGLQKEAIEKFYDARLGEWESFNLDLSHLSMSGTMRVRFEGKLKIEQVLSPGITNILLNFYTVEFKLKETYD